MSSSPLNNPQTEVPIPSRLAKTVVPKSTVPTTSPEFNDPKCDIVLRSSDYVDFRVSSYVLQASSTVFAEMLEAANDSGTPIPLAEDSKTLVEIVRFMKGIGLDNDADGWMFEEYADAEEIIRKVQSLKIGQQKYGLRHAEAYIKETIRQVLLLLDKWSVLSAAIRLGDMELVRLALPGLYHEPPTLWEQAMVEELGLKPYLVILRAYHATLERRFARSNEDPWGTMHEEGPDGVDLWDDIAKDVKWSELGDGPVL